MKILKTFLIPIVLVFAFTNLNAQTKVACNPAACAKTSKTPTTSSSDSFLAKLVDFTTTKASCNPADCAKKCADNPNCNPADCKRSLGAEKTGAEKTTSAAPIATLVSTKVVSATEYGADVAVTEKANKKNCKPASCAKKCTGKTSL